MKKFELCMQFALKPVEPEILPERKVPQDSLGLPYLGQEVDMESYHMFDQKSPPELS